MFVFISVTPLVLMAVLGIYFMNLTQQASVHELERQLVTQKEKEIENFLNLTRGILEIKLIEDRPSLASFDIRELDNIASTVIRSNQHLSELALVNHNAARPNDSTAGDELVHYTRDGHLDPEYHVNHYARPGFTRALEGKIAYDPIEQEGTTWLLPLYIPLRNRDNTIIGVVYGKINIRAIESIVRDSALGEKGYTYLADSEHGIIFSSTGTSFPLSAGAQNFTTSVIESKFMRTILDPDSEFEGSLEKTPVLATGKHIRPLQAAFVVEWPKNDAMSLVYSSISRGMVFTLIVLVLVISLSIVFARNIVNPINSLKEGAAIIGEGDLNYVIHVATRDELEELAQSFNKMAVSLREVQDLRESKIIAQGLARSLEKEQELSKIKDTFIATASHQLRTPISVIRWISESLATGNNRASLKDMQNQIKDLYENSAKISLIISDLLTVSELGLNYKPANLTSVDLGAKIKDILERYEAEIERKDIAINIEKSHDGAFPVLVNELALRRVLENLIDNAITYSHEKSTITIRLTKEQGRVLCSIQDSGIGIPENEHPLIFGEFFRARNAVEKKNVGTGLGLFIVKTIIRGHRGEVSFESKQNEGSTFSFALPRAHP